MITKQEWTNVLDSAGFTTKMNNPNDASTVLDFSIDMSELSDIFLGELEENPDDNIDSLKAALKEMFPTKERVNIIMRHFIAPLKPMRIKIHQIRAVHIDKMLYFDGLVRTSTDVLPRIEIGRFETKCCGDILEEVQEEDEIVFTKAACPTCQNDCMENTVIFREDLSVKEDYQIVNMEEEPEGMKGRQPEKIECQLHGPFTKEGMRVGAGERVSVVGIYRIRKKGKKTVFERYIEVIGIEAKGKNYEDFDISEEDEAKFKEMSKNPNILREMSMTIAPNIEGLDVEKDAVVLQLFSGNLFSPEKRRGDIHMAFVGDPSVGKSQIARAITEIAPHCIRASGAPTTTVGLTAAAIQNPQGGFILEAGAAVLTDRGLLIIDEFDKMNEATRGALHEIMEDQICSVNKAGITATLLARCSILAMMNPKTNRFEPKISLISQIDLPPSLLSRFDLIFAIRDKPNPQRDRIISAAVFNGRDGSTHELKYTKDNLTKYIIYARSMIREMTTSKIARSMMTERYLELRGLAKGMGDPNLVVITHRQLEGMARLAEAHAKMRLSNVVEEIDAEASIKIIDHYLKTMCVDEDGNISTDQTMGGRTKSEKDKAKTLLEVLHIMAGEDLWSGRRYTFNEVMIKTEEKFTEKELDDQLEILSRAGAIFYNGKNDIKIHK